LACGGIAERVKITKQWGLPKKKIGTHGHKGEHRTPNANGIRGNKGGGASGRKQTGQRESGPLVATEPRNQKKNRLLRRGGEGGHQKPNQED